MANLTYDSFWDDLSRGSIDMDTDSFYILLINATGVSGASKTAHLKRSDVTANEITGTGYTAGGNAITCTVAKNTGTHVETFTFSVVTWPASTITAAGGIVYKHRGGASTADELVALVDFGGNVTSTAATFTFTPSAPITIQN